MPALRLTGVDGLPEITPGADLAGLIARAAEGLLEPGAVVCIAHKLVSKAEGRIVELSDVEPAPEVVSIAEASGRDPRHVQVVLDESSEIIRAERGALICRTHHGFVCANAGVDRSNAGPGSAESAGGATDMGAERVILLPVDPDGSARALRAALQRVTGIAPLAVLISDSFGRAWRIGQVDVAIGLAGLQPTVPPGGLPDRDGRVLEVSEPAVADELAAAAGLARTKAGGQGVVIAHGLGALVTASDGPGAAALLRARHEDLFGARQAENA